MNDNIIPFDKGKKPPKETENPYGVQTFTFNIDDTFFRLDKELMEKMFSDSLLQDVQLDQISDELFELQLLVEDNPEIAQFVCSHISKFTENMRQRLAKK